MKNKFGRTLLAFSYFVFLTSYLFCTSCARTGAETSGAATKLTTHRGDNYKIGVILPLSGKLSLYGKSTLHGIECALGIFKPCQGPINAELIIKDDKGQPNLSVAAVEELVNNDKVSIIIGPLSSSSIEAAAQKAQLLGVPLISLSQKEGMTEIGDNIFSVALTAASQVNEIVNWAVSKKKLRNFAVIYPLTPYGQIYKSLFSEAVKKANGKLVLADGYGEANLSFDEIFQRNQQKFDALFIPDSYRAVGYLSSAMLLQGIEGVQLLGNSRWNNKEIIERGGETMQNAVFVDGFFDNSSSSAVQSFVSLFEQGYHLKPTLLEAQGFDAARLAAKALQSTGGAHSADVRNALANIPDVEGSTGPTGFDEKRNVIKRIFILTVKNDNIMELEGAGKQPRPKDKYGVPKPESNPEEPPKGTTKY